MASFIPKFRDEKEDAWQSLWRGGVAELVATMIFLFVGTGSVVATQAVLGNGLIAVPSLTLIALANGFSIMTMIYSVGEISGGHLNPVVTWAILITNRISVIRALVYVIAQLTGAVIGSALLLSFLPPSLMSNMGCLALNSKLNLGQGFGFELIFTFILIFVIFATAISPFAGKLAPLSGSSYGPGKLAPFAIGMTVLILHTAGIPFTGSGMNPARAFGPAIVNGCWNNHWMYWIAPLCGSTLAAVIAQLIFLNNPNVIVGLIAHKNDSAQVNAQSPQTDEPQTFTFQEWSKRMSMDVDTAQPFKPLPYGEL